MDSRKTGIRIKDEVLQEDKRYWSLFEEPYWRRQQLDRDAKSPRPFVRNNKPLTPRNGITPILDELVLRGVDELNSAMIRLESIIQPKEAGVSDLFFNGNGKDPDLLRPWETARQDLSKRDDCGEIQGVIKRCFDQLKSLNVDTKRKLCSARVRTTRLRAICREFAANPPLEQLFSFRSEEELRMVKASCAYEFDIALTARGGDERGFPWIMAMRDLCSMKARAISGGDTITIPHSVRDRLETHRYWSSL
jgi:RNA-dependent RNA polymerase